MTLAPRSEETLRQCIVKKQCKTAKGNLSTHVGKWGTCNAQHLLNASWFSIPRGKWVAKIPCFPALQEPWALEGVLRVGI